MSTDKPDELITLYNSEEVRRAVLDEYMDLYKSEIERSLSDFRKYKSKLLSLLFHDYNRAQPSDSQERCGFASKPSLTNSLHAKDWKNWSRATPIE